MNLRAELQPEQANPPPPIVADPFDREHDTEPYGLAGPPFTDDEPDKSAEAER